MSIDAFDRLSEGDARAALERCCGCREWVERMMARRPFGDAARLSETAGHIWRDLTPEAWREAFAHHPRIGDLESLRRHFAATADLAGREQSGVAAAAPATLDALAEGNRAYEERFGYIFIVCATGKSADEMLALLRGRMVNDPKTELGIAAEEQLKIMRLRLERMLGGPA
jgi:2-oxo-4-hydroxy-4-carboxy-5-ureidoimidazoline decarboxylase